jgi:hypothetical protein
LQVKVFMPGSPPKAFEQDWRHTPRDTSRPFGRPVNALASQTCSARYPRQIDTPGAIREQA